MLAAVPNPACRCQAAYITFKLAFYPAQAAISSWSYAVMGAIFALSTPLGIAIGLGVQSTYNEHSPTALAVEGIFDSISAGAQGACVLRGAGVPPLVGRACAERGVTYTCALCPEDRLKCLLAQEIVLYTWPATGCLRSSPAAVWAGRVLPPQAALRIG